MKGFKRCDKGHFYKEGLSLCPYCPENKDENIGGMKTKIEASDSDKTQIFGAEPSNNLKTQVFEKSNEVEKTGNDLGKTFISGVTDDQSTETITPRATRKMTGWLISYTIDPMGADYRIYEGKNRIGKDASLEITVSNDPTVSGDHAVILFRSGVWYLEDEMSANGTFLNGKELAPRNPVKITDNDEIKVGDTIFKFKAAL